MTTCKKCGSAHVVKNGMTRGCQRYLCKSCSFNFIERDSRTSPTTHAKKSIIHLLCSFGKIHLQSTGKLLNIHPSQISKWGKENNHTLKTISDGSIREVRVEELAEFINSVKISEDSILVAKGTPWDGCTCVVMLCKAGRSSENTV